MTTPCSIFWDIPNTLIPMREVASDIEGVSFAHSVRLHYASMLQLACAHRPVAKGVCVGSSHPKASTSCWDNLRSLGLEVEVFERSAASKTEQAVDQALQIHMLRVMADQSPGTAVLLSGDGAGFHLGKGFHADLRRMYAAGWGIEVLSWDRACHPALRAWAQEVGVYVPLDAFYKQITFLPGVRDPERVCGRQLAEPRDVACTA